MGALELLRCFTNFIIESVFLLKKAVLSRTLVEKYYGELDYEWIPPDFK